MLMVWRAESRSTISSYTRRTALSIVVIAFIAAVPLSQLAAAFRPSAALERASPDRKNSGKTGTASSHPIEVVPFELYSNHIYVPVHVNGSDTFSFLLDTGASVSFLSERVAQSLSLKVKDDSEKSVGTGEGRIKLGFAREVTLELGRVDLLAKRVAVIPSEEIEAALGHRLDGLLGSELFKRYVVEIDYQAGCLRLFEPRGYSYEGIGEAIPLKLVGNRPFIRTRVAFDGTGDIEATVVLDIGDNTALSFHTPFVKKHGLPAAGQRAIPHFTLGLGGKSPEMLSRAEQLQIGRFVVRRPVTALAEATKGSMADPSYDGAVGGEILRRFRITFDYSSKMVFVEPNAAFDEPYDVDMSGLSLACQGADLKTIVVKDVENNSPAAEAGLRAGDAMTSINGRPISELTVAQIKKMFMQAGIEYLLGIKRGETDIQLKMKTRRLI